ncbi:hypothetical protein [Paenibacillus gansuensis]|uniref:Uncharacterized protein n=1 Tax=Paenibacillus gansuensis TaxID=306542 RepID=A0ABW5PEA3_9BACL
MLLYLICYIGLWTATLIMTLTIFRFKVGSLKWQVGLAALTMAPVSTLIHYHAFSFLTILQVVCYTVLLMVFFKVNVGYAALMAVTGFFLSGLPDLFTDWYYEKVLGIQVVNTIAQVSAIIVFDLAIAWFFLKFRLGFSFIPQHKKMGRPDIKTASFKGMFISLALAGVIAVIGALYVTSEAGQKNILAVLFSTSMILSVLFRLYYVKELED